jgi:hypothetical protein
MRNEGLFGNLLKIAGAGALLYGAYKLGEYHANQKVQETLPEVKEPEVIKKNLKKKKWLI